jgi:hypothetical protein
MVAELDPLTLTLRRARASEHGLNILPARLVRRDDGHVAFCHLSWLSHWF